MEHTILIADDQKYNITLLKVLLQQYNPDFKIITAVNGEETYRMACENLPDVIFLDYMMPKGDGLEVLENLKKNYLTSKIPVIIQTGYGDDKDLELLFNAGAFDYVMKPYRKIEFFFKIKAALIADKYQKKSELNRQKNQNYVEELNKLSLIIRQTANVAILISNEGNLEWANESFVNVYGCQLDEFIKKYGANFKNVSFDKERATEYLQLLQKNKQPITYVNECEVNGDFKWIQTTLTPILDEDKIEKIIAIETDVTKEKNFERELVAQNLQMKILTDDVQQTNIKLEKQQKEILLQKQLVEEQRQKTDDLLSNILPHHVVQQLKTIGYAKPRNYKKASVMFTDFKGFTKSCEHLSPDEIVSALHTYFSDFDGIIIKHFIEKIKTIGDSYMCVGGVPLRNRSNPFNVVLAALEIQFYMQMVHLQEDKVNLPNWQLRIGIHTGELIAGVVGKIKFAYDIWGDTVNIAKRIEAACEVGKVNISETTDLIRKFIK